MTTALLCAIVLAGAPLHAQPPNGVDAYLKQLQQDKSDYLDRFCQVVVDSVGTPYHDGPLGEGPEGKYDPDPLIDLSRADCVTFVEQCAALAAGTDYADTTGKLQEIRYAGGAIDFATRNHFMVAEWIPNNAWCKDITTQLGVPAKRLTRTISKSDFFQLVKAPDLGQDIADRAVTISYIPIEAAGAAARAITKPSLVIFIGHIDWLFALHCGVYLPDAEGGGTLYHASSKAEKVVGVDLAAYAGEQSSRYLGFTVYEITPPTFGAAAK